MIKAVTFAPPWTWAAVSGDIVRLEKQAFGKKAFSPAYLRSEFESRNNSVVLLVENETSAIVGFTFACPIGAVEPTRRGESTETAYVCDTIIDERYRECGLVGTLMDRLESDLRDNGYLFLERDAAVNHSYSEKIARHYSERIVAMGKPVESVWGPQVFFRIRL